jgi:hypothetical protein
VVLEYVQLYASLRGMWNVLEKLTIATPKELIDTDSQRHSGVLP